MWCDFIEDITIYHRRYEIFNMFCLVCSWLICFWRFNEMKPKQMREEEETESFKQRSGRLAKWREMAEQAAQERKAMVRVDCGIETLVLSRLIYFSLRLYEAL